MIYLDYNATTPIDPSVLEAMQPYLREAFGNASSRSHSLGWEAQMAVDRARAQVARSIGAKASEIIFTSGATESNNMAILGAFWAQREKFSGQRPHLITAMTEHKAVLEVCLQAQKWGADLTLLPVNRFGQVEVEEVARHLKPQTILISIMAANNEIGSLNPIAEIGQLAKEKGIWFHTDAAQAAGKIPLDVQKMSIDLLSISGHKIYGPKGVGALYIRSEAPKVELQALFFGGSQEKGLRPGTLNVPGIVGLGKALELAESQREAEELRLRDYAQELIETLRQESEDIRLNGHPEQRLAGNISLTFPGLNSDIFALGLSGLAVSSSSACTSESPTPSHVLKAIGLSDDLARATLRIGLGRPTSRQEVAVASQKLLDLIRKNKEISVH